MKPYIGASCPEVYFLKKSIVRLYLGNYREPKNSHALLDGILRLAVATRFPGGLWIHHETRGAIYNQGNQFHIVDCLNRAPANIFRLAREQSSGELPTTIHTGLDSRAYAFQRMLERANKKTKQEEITWNNLLKPASQSPSIGKIAIKLHQHSAFRGVKEL